MEELLKLGFELVKENNPVREYLIKSLVGKENEVTLTEEQKEEVKIFLNPVDHFKNDKKFINFLRNDDYFPNLIKGADIIREHFNNGKRVLIITDYDCDGACSFGSIVRLIDDFGNWKAVINKRKFGNGINKPLLEYLDSKYDLSTFDLIVTADHGVGSIPTLTELLDRYQELKIVITDHHIPLHPVDDKYKDRLVIVDPHLSDKDVFSKKLSGATIAALTFICVCLDIKEPFDKYGLFWDYLNSVTDFLGTSVISDVMDLSVPFNRYLVIKGIDNMSNAGNRVFTSIKEIASSPGFKITLDDVKYTIVPIINSANRLHHEEYLENLLLYSSTFEEHKNWAHQLWQLNEQRKLVTNAIVNKYNESEEKEEGNGIVLKIKTNLGINGLVAGKIGELEQKPTVCFINSDEEEGYLHGSLRSIIGVDLLTILEKLKNEGLVVLYGGHKEACGCKIEEKNFDKFKERFKQECPSQCEKENFKVDLVVRPEVVDWNLAKKVKELEPFGNGFKEPTFYSEFIVSSPYFNGRTMFCSSDIPTGEEGEMRRIRFIAFNNGKYKVDNVFKDFGHIGCSFIFTSENIVPGRTPKLRVSYATPLTPETEIFSLI